MAIQIPLRLRELLEREQELLGAVTLSLAEFTPWLEENKTPFFPEYTDHGPKHIEDVLQTAEALISDEAWESGVISPGDSATLIISVLLHDAAMHLREDGFVELAHSDSCYQIVDGFNDEPWPFLWQEFCWEAKRYDSRKLISLFGDTEPVDIPELYPEKWNERNLKLIGEFLRRHHHRLAHEIALFGVPGPNNAEKNRLQLKGLQRDMADLAGVIARSHGVPIRPLFRYLEDNYPNKREQRGIHSVFLMVLLRVSDYLQVQAERAPEQRLQVSRIRSPFSLGEWKAHQAVVDITDTHEDPESIYIEALPTDVKTYLRLKDWLKDIQSELDSSWAILGEVYGLYKDLKLNRLGLAIRRVRSNLDDEVGFAGRVNYVLYRTAFEAANPELLKLMIRPLYGDRPEIGTRELVQNAVDAVRELQFYQEQRSDLGDIDLQRQDADVVVSLEKSCNGNWCVKVSDRGIGMTAETIRDYFLKAGISFRQSSTWRKTFENESSKSQVLRSGRFGMGILSAFLLGDGVEIHVSTRHVGVPPQEGIEFSTTLDTDVVELQRVARPVGTTITVRGIDNVVGERLIQQDGKSWDWYCLRYPEVLREIRMGSEVRNLGQKYHLPAPKSELPPNWRQINHPKYQDIHWTYSDAPDLACNGILVTERNKQPPEELSMSVMREKSYYPMSAPKVSVFDADGELPLTLQRTRLQGWYPFQDELVEDMAKDLVAYALVNAPDRPLTDISVSEWYSRLWYPPKRRLPPVGLSVWHWFSNPQGISFVDNWHLRNLGICRALLVPVYCDSYCRTFYRNRLLDYVNLSSFQATFGSSVQFIEDSIVHWILFALTGTAPFPYARVPEDQFGKIIVCGRRLLIEDRIIDGWNDLSESPFSDFDREWDSNGWVLIKTGECPPHSFDLEKLREFVSNGNPGERPHILNEYSDMLAEWYIQEVSEGEPSPIARAWSSTIESPFIPFDSGERHKIIERVHRRLGTYIEAHKTLAQSNSEKDVNGHCQT